MLMPTYIDISKNNHKSLLNSVVSVREANRMAYKDMKLSLYLCITLGLFGLEVIGAIFIDNITTVFNFASAFGVTCLAFWFPAGYYLLAEKRFKKDERGQAAQRGSRRDFKGFSKVLGSVGGLDSPPSPQSPQ